VTFSLKWLILFYISIKASVYTNSSNRKAVWDTSKNIASAKKYFFMPFICALNILKYLWCLIPISAKWHIYVYCNRFDINSVVRFCQLAHEPQTRFTLVYLREVPFEMAARVNAFLSNNIETMKLGEFLFSSILVLVAPCLRGRKKKKVVGRIKCCRLSQNSEDEKTSFMQPDFYMKCIVQLICNNRIFKYFKNIII